MNNQKGLAPIAIILIIVGVLVVAGGTWYTLIRTEPLKPPKLEKLAGLNPMFKTFLSESAKKYPDLSIDKFTVTESKEINIIGDGFSKITALAPVWTYSPDKTKAVSSLGYYGEPDSSLELYNRKGDKKIELLKVCGTPCSYRGEFWLDNKQFVFIQTHEYYPPNGEVRCAVDTKCTEVVSISLYNLEKNTETIYQSPEIDKPILLPSWPDRDLQIKAVCEGLYGKEDPYCQTLNWKTYRNETYGFEVKYPLNCSIEEINDESAFCPVGNIDTKGISRLKYFEIKNCNTFVDIYNNPNNLGFGEWDDIYHTLTCTGSGFFSERTSFLLNGVLAIKGLFGCCAQGQKAVAILKDKKVYIIYSRDSLSFADDSPDKKEIEDWLKNDITKGTDIFSQILSTFKFIK